MLISPQAPRRAARELRRGTLSRPIRTRAGTGLGGLLGGWTYQALGPARCFAIAAVVVLIGLLLATAAQALFVPDDAARGSDAHASEGKHRGAGTEQVS